MLNYQRVVGTILDEPATCCINQKTGGKNRGTAVYNQQFDVVPAG